MWLSERAGRGTDIEDDIRLGEVTIAGDGLSVLTQGEERTVSVASAGGYIWRPKSGEQVVVLKCDDSQSTVCGALLGDVPEDLLPGEVLIKSAGGAAIKLANDGSVSITGKLCLNGIAY